MSKEPPTASWEAGDAVTPARIFHITQPELWQAAVESGSYTESTRGKTLAEEGFIHCSLPLQVEMVADLVYGDWTDPLVLLVIETALVGSEIRVENLSGGNVKFPHIYGPLPTSAVSAVHPMTRDETAWRAPKDV